MYEFTNSLIIFSRYITNYFRRYITKIGNEFKKQKSPLRLLESESRPSKENPFHPLIWKLMLIFGSIIYGLYSVLVDMCKLSGKVPFRSISLVVMIEFLKLLASLVTIIQNPKQIKCLQKKNWTIYLPFLVPAFLYSFNNNIAVHAQMQMDPATFQILCNLKIIFTAVLYRIIIKRPVSNSQWIALNLLTLGGLCSSYGNFESNSEKIALRNYITFTGLLLMLLHCFVSGLVGVYTEKILKCPELPFLMQNAVLYSFGVIFNMLMYFIIYKDADNDISAHSFFTGFSYLTWIIIVTQAANGLIMSSIMKYSTNITRLFYIAGGTSITIVLSAAVLHLQINSFLIASCILIVVALMLYYKE